MVKQGADPPRRTPSRTSKRGSQISNFKNLTLLDRTAPAPGADDPATQPPLHPPGPSECLWGFPDSVYLHAATIFHNTHQEKAAAHRLISYGKRPEVPMPKARDDASQRCAYELAFNTLKYQELLEDIMVDSCFYLSQPMPDDLMSLVAVMLYDFQDRKFLPRERPANEREEASQEVREVEGCLLRFKTKLAASLARYRIKLDLLTIDCMLPESVRRNQERAGNLPLYAWVNTLKISREEVCDVLKRGGFSQVKSVGQLEGQTFCQDPHCQDVLVFPAQWKAELYQTKLLSQYKLVIQDKTCCVGPWAVRPLLAEDSDVLMAGSYSALTIAHVAAVATSARPRRQPHSAPHGHAHGHARVFVCVGDCQPTQREELQEVLSNMGCKNIKLIPEGFLSLDVCDLRLQKVQLILLTPQCSVSAVSNPVEYILQENGDKDLLQDLSQGAIAQAKLDALVTRQKRDIDHALRFPKVQSVVYTTCSSYPEENEEVVRKALQQGVEEDSKLMPYRLSSLPVFQSGVCEEGVEERNAGFFRLEATEQSNGCFIAVLNREPDPETVETAQEVLARAAATGLLDGVGPNQPAKKERRGQPNRQTAPSRSRGAQTRPRVSLSSQSRAAGLLRRETRQSGSVPTVGRRGSNGAPSPPGKATPLRRCPPKSIPYSAGPAYSPTPATGPAYRSLVRMAAASDRRPPSASAAPPAPPAPPRARPEVLRPVALTLPPALFPAYAAAAPQKSRTPPPAPPARTLSYLRWKSSPPAAPLPSTLSSSSLTRDSVRHPRPWL